MSDGSVILFTTEKPSFYLLNEIYDSVKNPTGTIIPRPNSLVLDPINNGLLRRVTSVDPNTLNSSYGPVYTSLLTPPPEDLEEDNEGISIIDYGNSRFYLFYDKAESPTKLNIDKKVIILGDDAAAFEIARYDAATQKYHPISLYFDTNGVYTGTKIPLNTITTASNAKIPTNCHTSHNIQDDDVYHMFIYDYAGTQCGSIKLYAKQAIINNAYEDELLIYDFIAEATQMDDNGFYLFPDQDPASLVITPRVVLSNGTTRAIGIDNAICHLYGFEGFTAAYPGQTVELIIKYFLHPNQQAVTKKLITSGNSRFLVNQVTVTVKDPGTNEYSVKIVVVPVYLASVSKYTLVFFMYTLGDNNVRNITPLVNVSAFDGRLMGIDQSITMTLRIRDVFPEAETDFIYQQPVILKLAPYDYYDCYVIRDSVGDTYGVYGVDSPILARPVLYYDSSIEKYFIPTSKFSNKNTFLEAFYYKSRPLYDSQWLNSPVNPTHFTIRNAINGMLMISAPISIESYGQNFSLINVENQNQLLGSNCLVEFLRYENNQYTVLFGAPVDVHSGTFI